ncbi:uncharacterized protein LOC130752002 [Actinidia eriantha]|uniref:uncharacterized protein LOC130752002 n=1 Tax=Actinidia eriantha TaxID=165200 RepID=UPI00258927F4|nr:uncharacterized protein LOC130752002 [Actinidia eriantha]XP_057461772.1 uncharacterized protein LOC130752002 [Actinidia eriantha]
MRRSLGRFPNPTIGNASLVASSSSFCFSTSTGAGRGRGRGSPGGEDDEEDSISTFSSGLGHGRVKPLPSTPILPSFSSFINTTAATATTTTTTGRGKATAAEPPQPHQLGPRKPIFFTKDEQLTDSETPTPKPTPSQDTNLPSSILSVLSLSGAGRGKQTPLPNDKPTQENRHLKSRQPTPKGRAAVGPVSTSNESKSTVTPKLSRDEAVMKAVGILSRGGGGSSSDVRAEEGGRGRSGFRGRGNRSVRGRGGRSGRGRGRREGALQDMDDDTYGAGLYLGDNADGEKLAKRVGPDNMNKLVEAFEEMSGRVLPSPMDDAYLNALHTNFLIECEPEYLMEEFGKNPDIEEKPPIPLHDALEKMKPFLMAYEGIQSHEEWEEVVKETMEKVPIMKELVDYYSGPDRVTAKNQQEELERVAKTLPESTPASVKRFTDRALLSLQSNPGWGFDKKCQFMDKLVWEVSQHYK